MKPSSWILIGALIVLHQDYWNWSSSSLWFGFLPVQLGYHMIISLLAALCWWTLVTYDWPADEDSSGSDAAASGVDE